MIEKKVNNIFMIETRNIFTCVIYYDFTRKESLYSQLIAKKV